MKGLSERQNLVLALLVRDYIESAEPISSGRLVDRFQLDFSSATVRNDMAILEDMGLLYQPYTSAGRIPTKSGYRYYVQRLMGEDQLPQHIQEMIRHQFYQARNAVDDWLSLSASVLAQHSQVASIVTPLHTDKARLKQTALLSTRGRQVLMVLVLNSGEVHQQTMVLDETYSQADLANFADQINNLAGGMNVVELSKLEVGISQKPLKDLLATVSQIIAGSEILSTGEIYRDGLANMLSEPEFAESDKAKQTLGVFEDRVMLDDLLSRTVFDNETPGVHVIIGGEDTWEQLEDCSLIIASYGSIGHAMGAVGILGPLRMSYSRGVSTVRFVSDLISELISESMLS
jgi:heat-inducible transcriptional repressor